MSIWSLIYQQSVFKRYHSANILRVFTNKMAAKSTGIYMEQITSRSSYVYKKVKSKFH